MCGGGIRVGERMKGIRVTGRGTYIREGKSVIADSRPTQIEN